MDYLIREGKKDDSYSIMHVVTVAWNETYKGIVDDDFLDELKNNEDESTERYFNDFDKSNLKDLVLEIDNNIVGFVRYGRTEDKDFINCGEIIALYIIKKYQRFGYGRKLVEMAKLRLKDMGFDSMIISCLKGNPTNSFYEHLGGKYIKDGIFEKLNLKENVYYFEI